MISLVEKPQKWFQTKIFWNKKKLTKIVFVVQQDQPEAHDDKAKRAEFSLPTWLVLNALEIMGFKVVTSGPFITGLAKHDQREFIWTLYKAHDEWESSSKWKEKAKQKKNVKKAQKSIFSFFPVKKWFGFWFSFIKNYSSYYILSIFSISIRWNIHSPDYNYNFRYRFLIFFSINQLMLIWGKSNHLKFL